MQVRRLLRILNVLGLFLRDFGRILRLIFTGIWFALRWCRGFVSKRDEAGGAVGAVGADRQAAADVVLPSQAQGPETSGQEAAAG
jgi:hypothetical protein